MGHRDSRRLGKDPPILPSSSIGTGKAILPSPDPGRGAGGEGDQPPPPACPLPPSPVPYAASPSVIQAFRTAPPALVFPTRARRKRTPASSTRRMVPKAAPTL